MKTLFGVFVAMFLAVPAFAQVTCSPAVKPAICKEVATLWNPLLNHGLVSGAIPAELMSDDEYKKRLQEDAEDEKRGNTNCRRQCFNPLRHHVFDGFTKIGVGRDRIALVRDRPSSYVPERIVVSTAAFNGSDLKVDKTGEAKLVDTGEYDHGEVINHMKYIVGYFAGVLDTLLDE
jgi:hypothetical protein